MGFRGCSTAVLATLLAACGSDATAPGEPLLGNRVEPRVLVEQRRFEPPPSRAGTRFVKGWWPWERDGELLLVPDAGGGRLEAVSLGGGPRELVLETAAPEAESSARLLVRVAGQPVAELVVAPVVRVPLPESLPLGRFPIDLEFAAGGEVAIVGATLSSARPAGEARLAGADLVQSGSSLVEITVPRATGATRVVGSLEITGEPLPDQRFELHLDTDGPGAEARWEWHPSWLDRLREGRRFEIELPAGGEFLRLRLLVVGEGATATWRGLAVAGATSAEPPPPRPVPSPPAVVVVYSMGGLRADFVGHLGGPPGISPTIDRLAEGGATFLDHSTVSPHTLMANQSLFAGRFPVLSAVPGSTGGLAGLFAAAGYRTALFSTSPYLAEELGLGAGFETSVNVEPSSPQAGMLELHRRALDWLAGLGASDHAFVHLQTTLLHLPYEPPEPYLSDFTAGIDSAADASVETVLAYRDKRAVPSPADRRRLAALYAASVAAEDAALERFLDELLARHAAEDVLLVVTSSHGDELFDHDGVFHGETLYQEQLHVPLVVWSPGRVVPTRVEIGTDTLDLHATLAALAGGSARGGGPGSGRELWSVLDRGGRGKPVRFAALPAAGLSMARSARFKVIYAPRGEAAWGMGSGLGRTSDAEYVFDLAADPEERENLAGTEVLEVSWLRAELDAWLATWSAGGGRPLGIDEAALRRLTGIGHRR